MMAEQRMTQEGLDLIAGRGPLFGDPLGRCMRAAVREIELCWKERTALQRAVDAAFELSNDARLTDKYCDPHFKKLDEALEAVGRTPTYSEAGRVYEVNERAMAMMAEAARKRSDGDG